jgi:hypothetical protein
MARFSSHVAAQSGLRFQRCDICGSSLGERFVKTPRPVPTICSIDRHDGFNRWAAKLVAGKLSDRHEIGLCEFKVL